MTKTTALFSQNIFYALGLQNLIPDYKLQNITPQDFENRRELLAETELALVDSDYASSTEIAELIELLLENPTLVIYLAKKHDKSIPRLCSIGCQGIIEKEQASAQLSVAIQAVTSGGTYYSQQVLENSYMVLLGPLVELFEELDATTKKLTPKEKEIFDLYVSGLSLTKLMKELAVSKLTINTHMESIRAKIGVSSNREITTKYQITRLKPKF